MRAIGFDLGGTLIRYEGVPLSWQSMYREALCDAAEKLGLDLSEEEISEAESVLLKYNTRVNPRSFEVTADKIFHEVQSAWGIERGLCSLKEIFFSYFQRKVEIFPETLGTLRYLKDQGLKIGVFTDVPYGMDKDLVRQDLGPIEEYLDLLLTSVDVGFRKPDSIVYEELSNRLGVSHDEMIYVGDEKKDIEGANNVGMFSVLVDREGSKESFNEIKRIESLDDLRGLL